MSRAGHTKRSAKKMNKQNKHQILWLMALFLIMGVIYVTVDDLKYELDPNDVISSPTETQIQIWKNYVASVKSLCTTSNVSDNIESDINSYILLDRHPEIIEPTTSLTNTLCYNFKEQRALAEAISVLYTNLLNEDKSKDAAVALMSHHLSIQFKVARDSRQIVTFAVAKICYSSALGNLETTYKLLSEAQCKLLCASLDHSFLLLLEPVAERDYSLLMKEYVAAKPSALIRPFWMPKDTANIYYNELQRNFSLCHQGDFEEAKNRADSFCERSPRLRNYLGTYFFCEVGGWFPSQMYEQLIELDERRIRLINEMQNQGMEPTSANAQSVVPDD